MSTGAAAAPNPLPTPYDIVPIPYFPVEPGLLAWLAVGVAAILVGLLIARIPLSRRSAPASAVATAQRELAALSQRSPEAKELLGEASLIIRRLLAALGAVNLRSASAPEIRQLSQSQPEQIRPVLEAAARIEETRFLPSVSQEVAEIEIEALSTALREARDLFNKPRGPG